jgi:hypothetical protein
VCVCGSVSLLTSPRLSLRFESLPALPEPPPKPPPSLLLFLAGVYTPNLSIDAFMLQAATNVLLGHFLGLVCSLWILYQVADGGAFRVSEEERR